MDSKAKRLESKKKEDNHENFIVDSGRFYLFTVFFFEIMQDFFFAHKNFSHHAKNIYENISENISELKKFVSR